MKKGTAFFLVALALTLVIAVVVSQFASGNPDGLEYVAEEEGFIETAEDHALDGHALADYGGDDRVNLALAGLIGVVVTLGVGFGIFWLARSNRQEPAKKA